MKRHDRLKEIKRIWKIKKRHLQWSKIQWEPFNADGNRFNTLGSVDVAPDVTLTGHFFIAWGKLEKEVGMPWDHFLLYWLYTWYLIPEEEEVPFFVNESARVICFSASAFAQNVARLFQGSDCVQLGLKTLDVERIVVEA